jgi:hypothetical protein
MHSTPNPKQTDPHDLLEIAPDVVLVAHADKAHDARIPPSDSRTRMGSDFSVGPSVLPVDKTFRAAPINKVQVAGDRSMGTRAIRGFIGFVLAVCIGVAGIVWQAYGEAVKQMVAGWAPQFVLTSSPPLAKSGLPEQPGPPAVQASTPQAASPQPAALTQTATAAAAPSPESAQSLQSMARELASLREEIGQLKASQQQMSRDMGKPSEVKASETKASENRAYDARASVTTPSGHHLRPRMSVPPRQWAAAPARRPISPLPPPAAPPPLSQAAAAPPLPQAAAPYVPRQPESQPQTTLQPEAELVPRPPMPVR